MRLLFPKLPFIACLFAVAKMWAEMPASLAHAQPDVLECNYSSCEDSDRHIHRSANLHSPMTSGTKVTPGPAPPHLLPAALEA